MNQSARQTMEDTQMREGMAWVINVKGCPYYARGEVKIVGMQVCENGMRSCNENMEQDRT